MDEVIKGRGAQINKDNRFDSLTREVFVDDAQHDAEILEVDNLTELVEVYPKSIVNKVVSPDIPSEWSLNPYQGCEHGCVYCYARTTHEYWGYSAGQDFEKYIMYKPSAPELLDKKLQSKNWKASPIMLSGNTDCYQPAERKLEITRRLLEVCLKHKHPVGIITKNSLILRDLDVLQKLASHNLVHVHLSITTLDESLRRNLEPRTASTKNRFKTVKILAEKGIPVNVMMAPIIPGLNSDEIFDIAKEAQNAGAFSLSHTMVRLNGAVALIFEDWIRKVYPLKANRVMNLIAQAQGGQVGNYNFGERMKGKGVFAASISQQIKLARKKYNLSNKMPEFNLAAYEAQKIRQIALF